MDDLPRQTLIGLVVSYGRDLGSDARRCEALLRDSCPQHRRQIKALVYAMKESVPADLLGRSGGTPIQILLPQLAQQLQDKHTCDEEYARWAVETWAIALGVASSQFLNWPNGRNRATPDLGEEEATEE